MKIVTLRNISPDLKRVIQQRARQTGSMSKAVIALLEEAAGIQRSRKPPHKYRDLSHLAGRWTQDEADAFDKELGSLRTVDPELWNK